MICPLCSSNSAIAHQLTRLQKTYYDCLECKAFYLDKTHYLDNNQEQQHYNQHNNDVHNKGYQNYVSNLVLAVRNHQKPTNDGLDYGCGTGPVATHLLKEHGYQNIRLYDPFFYDDDTVFDKQYDFIICSEVVEHFHHPDEEYSRLKTLLKANGTLYILTSLITHPIDEDWYYLKDATHVFLHSKDTMNYIKDKYGFKSMKIEGNLTILKV